MCRTASCNLLHPGSHSCSHSAPLAPKTLHSESSKHRSQLMAGNQDPARSSVHAFLSCLRRIKGLDKGLGALLVISPLQGGTPSRVPQGEMGSPHSEAMGQAHHHHLLWP